MRIIQEPKLNFEDVLLCPKRSTLTSRADVKMTRTFKFRNSQKQLEFCPIFASNMDGVGTFSMAKVLQKYHMMTVITKSTTFEQWKQAVGTGLRLQSVSVCTGTNIMWDADAPDYKTMQTVLENFPDVKFITVDVANAYHQNFVDFVKRIREEYPTKIIIAGNVVTADMTQELILAGADIIKVGVGPGSVCTTRTKTGIGYPQLSAVMECADAAHGLNAHIIADGGCTTSGDIVKAFAAGADFVMIGGMLAGHDECDGKVVDGKMTFYGMASETAMSRHNVPHREYRGVEGKTVEVPYRGGVNDTIIDILSGIRSACTYVGAKRLKSLSKCATFVRVNNIINTVYGNA